MRTSWGVIAMEGMEGLVPKRHKLRKRRNIEVRESVLWDLRDVSSADEIDAALRREHVSRFAAKVRGARAIARMKSRRVWGIGFQ